MIESTWVKTKVSLTETEKCIKNALAEHSIYDLNPMQMYILVELYNRDGQHPSVLAKAVGTVATSFTPILDVLEGRKLIERKPDPKDRRAVLIHLTAKGRVYGQAVYIVHEKVEAGYSK